MIRFDKRILTHFDWLSPILILPILLLSFCLIYEANEALSNKQIAYFLAGLIAFMLFFLLPIRKIGWLIPAVYWLNIALLISVHFFGHSRLGAQRWIEVPFINFTLQPSELMKPAAILMLAYMIKQNPPSQKGYGWIGFIKISFFILLPFFIILKEPDLGTASVLLLMGFGTIFIIGVNKKIWIALALLGGLMAPILYESLHDYQKRRILEFVGEQQSYQVKQSIIAIGNGGLTGKSADEATQTKFKFLPIATSDFIFAYTVERYGFIGGAILVLLYGFLIAHLLSLNYKLNGDFFAKSAVSAVAILIFIYVSVNIFMTIGFAPVVGVPLPFYSYGGSSFVTFMALFGILQNLLAFRFDPEYRLVSIRF